MDKTIDNPELPDSWKDAVSEGRLEKIYKQIEKQEKAHDARALPRKQNLYRALELCPLPEVQVVIFGQDPYCDMDQLGNVLVPKAMGMSFSVITGLKPPPSLKNIYKELKDDSEENPESFGGKPFIEPNHGNLTYWAVQGVLLLNTVLTVFPNDRELTGRKNPFLPIWMPFTLELIEAIKTRNRKCIYVLWGAVAQQLLAEPI